MLAALEEVHGECEGWEIELARNLAARADGATDARSFRTLALALEKVMPLVEQHRDGPRGPFDELAQRRRRRT